MTRNSCCNWGMGLLLLLSLSVSSAAITEGGTGMLFGADHAFNITAAEGWVLDNESGRHQEMHMLFYPKAERWTDSQVIVYGRSTPRGADKRGVAELVGDIVADFHAKGSTKFRALQAESVTHRSGKSVEVYHYRGDQWGNYEAGAYFVEENTINFLVYTARSEKVFHRHYADFVAMVRSYSNAFMDIKPTSDEAFVQLELLSKQDIATEEGREYERVSIQGISQSMANVASGCAGFFPPDEDKNFQVIFRISPLGEVSDAFTNPSNSMASCFVGMIGRKRYPPHDFDDFLLHLNMKFE